MGYADGGDLSDKIKEKKASTAGCFSEDEVMAIFVQICLALKYVHARKVLHRDLKAQNVFLTQAGIVKLGDFGVAKVLESTFAQAKTQIGTPFYLSPEICKGESYERKSDIWSLGVILYEMLAMKVPFQAPNLPGDGHSNGTVKPSSAMMLICVPVVAPSWYRLDIFGQCLSGRLRHKTRHR